jgi:hypothetical protein
MVDKNKNTAPPVASRPLFQSKPARKRKTKTVPGSATSDLNLPVQDPLALVPAGMVSARISQLDGVQEEDKEGKEELLKKQKMCSTTFDARSRWLRTAAPAGHNELPKRELPGRGAARGSSRVGSPD